MSGFGGVVGGTLAGRGVVELVGDLSKLRSDLKKAENEVSASGNKAEADYKARANRMIAVGGAIATAVVGLGLKAASSAKEWGGEVRKLSRELGINAKEASELAYVGQRLGVGTDALSTSFGIFAKHLAANDASVQKYGISLRDAEGRQRPFMQVLNQTADIFARMPDGPTKTAMALELFGRQGKALIPILNQGSAGLQELSQEAHKYGLVLTRDNLEVIQKLKVAERERSAAMKGLSVQLGLQVIPALTKVVEVGTGFLELIGKIPAPVRGAGVAAVGLAAGGTLLVGVLARLKMNLQTLGVDFAGATAGAAAQGASATLTASQNEQLASSTENAAQALDAEGAAAVGAAGSISATGAAAATASTQLTRQATAANAATAATETTRAASAGLGTTIVGMAGKVTKALGVIGVIVSVGLLVRNLFNSGKEEAKSWADKFVQSAMRSSNGAERIRDQMQRLRAEAKQLTRGVGDTASVQDVLAGSLGPVADRVVLLTDRADELKEKLKELEEEEYIQEKALGTAADRFVDVTQRAADFNGVLQRLVAAGAPKEFAEQLRQMGLEGMPIAQELLAESTTTLPQVVDLWKKSTAELSREVGVFAGMTSQEFTGWREGTISNFNGVEGALDSLAGKHKVTAKQILKAFEDQLKAQRDYEKNWKTLLARGLPEQLAKQLQEKGLEGAAAVKALANASASEFTRITSIYTKAGAAALRTSDAVGVMADETRKLDSRQLKDLNREFDRIKFRGDLRTHVTTILREQGPIPVKELKQILDNLGIKGTLRTRVLAAVDAAVRARITSISLSATVRGAAFTAKVGHLDRQTGGPIPGRPSDAVPVTAHGGEYVLRPEAVASVGLGYLDRLNREGAKALLARGTRGTSATAGAGTAGGISITIEAPQFNFNGPVEDGRKVGRDAAAAFMRELDQRVTMLVRWVGG